MATISRIFQPVELAISSSLRLDEIASHHLARVLRVKVGDKIILFNGMGGEYVAQIDKIEKKWVEVSIQQFLSREVESPLQIHLAQGIARGEKMDFIIQKAVELGVSSITPLITERCNVRLDKEREQKRMQHWQAVIQSACEQSGRNRLPTLMSTLTLPEWTSSVHADLKFILSPHVTEKLSSKAQAIKTIAILIGPEGGFSVQEVSLAQSAGFNPLNLGPRILRTETATLAAISILQSHFGDMQESNKL